MANGHFLVRNRHNHVWYGRIIIPVSLRQYFNGRRELRRSLKTSDKSIAIRRSRYFWLQCQQGFDQLLSCPSPAQFFAETNDFIKWLSLERVRGHCPESMAYYIETIDVLGRKHVIDLDDPKQEQEMALQLQADAAATLNQFKNNPEVLDRLLRISNTQISAPDNLPESPTGFHDAIDLYYNKLETQGRRGKKLAERTLLLYRDKLKFWQQHFGERQVHTLTLKELGEIQNWLTRLPSNSAKKSISADHAVKMAQNNSTRHPPISDKTREVYLSQLRGLLEYCYASGFLAKDISRHVEMPNTKLSRTIERLPFTIEDLQKIFPGKDYGVDFGIQKSGVHRAAKFWFPLMAAFTGARLEELGQLNTSDIRTCEATGIIYIAIENEGAVADGHKKRTKNLNSVRPIPIHSTLIEMGFLDYLKERQADKSNGMLFKLKRDKLGRLAKGVGSWFSRLEQRKNGSPVLGYIERRGVDSKGVNAAGDRWGKSFHSFRHTAIDNLRGKKMANGEYVREPDIGLIMGHDKAKLETASYGLDRSQLELRKAAIDAIDYPDVAFEEISWSAFKSVRRS